MSTLKQTLPITHRTLSPEAVQWRAFEREMAERAEARIATLQLSDPQEIYLAAREEIYAAYQERWHRMRKRCDAATIIETSVQATHSYLAKQSTHGLLYTFGYGMLGAGPIIEQLVELGVKIYDIRFSPRSRVHKWRKPFLREWLGDYYVHLPALGNIHYNDPSQGIELADPATGVPLVVQPLRQGQHVALMCVCKEHDGCHRSDAADEILKQIPDAILVPFPSLEHDHS
jgi:hypothetical protein